MKQLYLNLLISSILMAMVMIMVLISVAYLTLLERKLLGYIQIRKGPNKLGFIGFLQPLSDGVKLLSKEFYFLFKINLLLYIMSPMFMLILILLMWMIYPFYENFILYEFNLMYLICCLSLSVYGLLMSGWSSNSLYSMLGSIRALAQSISYEVVLSIILFIPMMMISSFNFMELFYYQKKMGLILLIWPLSFLFLISMMAELNRTPFDFSEGESELVSGFNVEYMSSGFILLFLSEYSSILLMGLLFNMMMINMDMNLFFFMKVNLLVILIIWIRGTMPRFRYDLLMNLCWLIILPTVLNYMIYLIFLKISF